MAGGAGWTARRVLSIAGWLLFATAVVGLGSCSCDPTPWRPGRLRVCFGGHEHAARAVQPGDLVITSRADNYVVGDVITYRVPAGDAAGGGAGT